MLIFLGVMLVIIVYGSYRTIRDRNFSYFRFFWNFMVHTFIKGDKMISAILWGTLFLSVGVSNVLGPMGFNFSYFNPLSHFMFGFLSRELFKIANDYYPFIDKVAAKFPKKIAKYITPATFAFVLCLGHGIMEEVQKLIPGLKSLVWTNLPDQIMDTVMDTGGITFSAKRTALFARLKPSAVDERQVGESAVDENPIGGSQLQAAEEQEKAISHGK